MHWDTQFREKPPRLPGWNFRGVSLSCLLAQFPKPGKPPIPFSW